MTDRQPSDPEIRLLDEHGEVTLAINDGQAMQAWERELMNESADILCRGGSEFIEVGLGLGISALRIANHPNTVRHLVIEKYQEVIDIFTRQNPDPPPTLHIIRADFFTYIHQLPTESCDGIFFDPALPDSMWYDEALWQEVVPSMRRMLRRGGMLIPFFTTQPYLRYQYAPHFSRVLVERRRFKAYDSTRYTARNSGDAYIQCYIKTDDEQV